MKSGKVLLGLLAGVATGALMGILFAPEKGSKTRQKISNKSDDYADGLKSKFNEFLDNMTRKYEETMEDAETLVAKGKAKYEDTKDDAESLLADGKTKYNEVKKEVKSNY
jgi:gas vesicle protein